MSERRTIGPAMRLGMFASALTALVGCAPLPPVPGMVVPPASTPAPAPARARAEPQRQPANSAAATDSTPSPDAERVLASISEPLTSALLVPPPARDTTRRAVHFVAPEAAYDTLRVERGRSDIESAVPVPSPTQPLGNLPTVGFAAPASAPASAPVTVQGNTPSADAPASTPPAATAPSATSKAAPSVATGECWRLQVSAPEEPAMAVSRRDAAQSLLVVAMVIELEKGLHKVRTRDCMTREAAGTLKTRAVDSGFMGAFIVNTAATPASAAPALKRANKPSASPKRKRM